MSEDSSEKTDLEQRLESARAKVGAKRRLYVADSPAGELILGSPRSVDYAAYRAMLFDDDAAVKSRAPNTLLLACAVDPDATGMRALLEDYVALAGCPEVASAVAKAIGTAKADQEKEIEAARESFRADPQVAARGYISAIQGSRSPMALVAAEHMWRANELQIQYIEAQRKR